jgi:hypothetical protein
MNRRPGRDQTDPHEVVWTVAGPTSFARLTTHRLLGAAIVGRAIVVPMATQTGDHETVRGPGDPRRGFSLRIDSSPPPY